MDLSDHYLQDSICTVPEGVSEVRQCFLAALRRYDSENHSTRLAKLVEPIIRYSRSLAEDDGVMPQQSSAVLLVIEQRFRLFAARPQRTWPITFRDARLRIEELFF